MGVVFSNKPFITIPFAECLSRCCIEDYRFSADKRSQNGFNFSFQRAHPDIIAILADDLDAVGVGCPLSRSVHPRNWHSSFQGKDFGKLDWVVMGPSTRTTGAP